MTETVTTSHQESSEPPKRVWHQLINLKLAALGQPTCSLEEKDFAYLATADSLLKRYARLRRLLSNYRCPADQRIQGFLNAYLGENGVEQMVEIPGTSLIADKPGMAREMSLPLNGNHFHSGIVDSYRLLQGVLHNPKSDRRTTKGLGSSVIRTSKPEWTKRTATPLARSPPPRIKTSTNRLLQ